MLQTIHEAFAETAERYPQRPAVRHKVTGRYRAITYREVADRVQAVASSLHNLGISRGDAVGIFSSNRLEWMLIDLAALQIGAVVVPIYPTTPPAELKYLIRDSRMRLIVVENTVMLSALKSITEQTPSLRATVLIEGGISDSGVIPFSGLTVSRPTLRPLPPAVTGDDLATIVYTSGTTGEPKGVMLTHRNILANVRAVVERFSVTCHDTTLSYLPLCHMFERTCGYYALLLSGGCVAYAESLNTVLDDVKSIEPTVLIAVPRVLEKAYERASAQVQRDSRLVQRLVGTALSALKTRADRRFQKKPIPLALTVQCALLDRLVAARFRAVAGRKLRLIACGGAPLERTLAKLYYILGFQVVEGYGLTEASPVVTCNSAADNRLGTVGKPLPGVEVSLGPGDEILVRGPSVMRGYWNKAEETKRALDPVGWLHTGDQGTFDRDGRLVITGRIKDLVVTSCGKKIGVSAIENLLQRSPYISQAAVFGDRRKYLSALLVPRRAALEEYALQAGLGLDYEELLQHRDIHHLVAEDIERLCSDLAPYERVKAFALVAKEFTTEDGLVTPTLKLRRQMIESRYQALIDSLYPYEEACTL